MRHVAQFYGLVWTTVKRIDKRHLERELGPVDLEDVRVIAMDEFAIHKSHRYAIMAFEMSAYVVRAFVHMRELAATHGDLAKRLAELEEKTEALAVSHDIFSRNTRNS